MAIDFTKSPEEQELAMTGPALERPLPNDDEDVEDL